MKTEKRLIDFLKDCYSKLDDLTIGGQCYLQFKRAEKAEARVRELEENSLEKLAEMCGQKYYFVLDYSGDKYQIEIAKKRYSKIKMTNLHTTIQDCVKEAMEFLKEVEK